MTDRELLEMAARAAGIVLNPVEIKNVAYDGDDHWIGYRTDCEIWPRGWFDPLTDDGDALRLAVKLRLAIEWDGDEISAGHAAAEFAESDPLVATRHAIVRAAAEIGRAMP